MSRKGDGVRRTDFHGLETGTDLFKLFKKNKCVPLNLKFNSQRSIWRRSGTRYLVTVFPTTTRDCTLIPNRKTVSNNIAAVDIGVKAVMFTRHYRWQELWELS